MGFFSCWVRFKLRFLWRKREKQPKPGSFRYDPLSYSYNFDDGGGHEETENCSRGFSSRFVAPATKPPQRRLKAVLGV